MKKLITLVFALFVASMGTVSAAEQLSEGSLSISPFLIDAVVEPGQSITKTITVFNTDTTDHTLSYAIQDFIPVGPAGEPRFLATNEQINNSYSMSSWVKITQQPEFIIPAKGSTTVKFEISPPADATAGGHYAAILFSFEDAKENAIVVSRKLGTLLLVDYGASKPQLNTTSKNDTHFVNKPYTSSVLLKNTGNVHLTPKGKQNIYNVFGRLVESLPINQNALHLLPTEEKTFTTKAQKWLAGMYTVETILYYSNNPTLETRQKATIWVWPILDLAKISLLGIFIGIMLYSGTKKYNRWIISQELR